MAIFFIFLASWRFTAGSLLQIFPPTPPEFVVIVARQRSGSSTLSNLIGSHPCSLSGNEIWRNSTKQDPLGAHRLTNMTPEQVRQQPHTFLKEIHDNVCTEAIRNGRIASNCKGKCTISVKMFDVHHLSQEGIFAMVDDPDFRFVVLERNVEDEYCSHYIAVTTGDFGTTPGGHKKMSARIECGEATPEFVDEHTQWFSSMRNNLRSKGRSYLDIPFALVASCELKELIASILGFLGLYTPVSVGILPRYDAVFKPCEVLVTDENG